MWIFRERQFWVKRWRFYKIRSEKLARIGVKLFCGKSFRQAMRIRDGLVGRAVQPLNYEHALLAIINRCDPSHASATSCRWANTELFFGIVKQELVCIVAHSLKLLTTSSGYTSDQSPCRFLIIKLIQQEC